MRGTPDPQMTMLSMRTPEQCVPPQHRSAASPAWRGHNSPRTWWAPRTICCGSLAGHGVRSGAGRRSAQRPNARGRPEPAAPRSADDDLRRRRA
jgi:hypothetical protein